MTENKNITVICFDATELDNFELCPLKWHMFHHRHIIPKQTESYFEKGTLIHYLLELYYRTKLISSSVSNEEIEKIIEAARVKSLQFDLTLEEVAEHIFQFREYVRYYEDENIIPLYVEEPFTVKIYPDEDKKEEDEEMEVFIAGQPDLIFRYTNTDNIAVMDHKRMQREFQTSPLRNQFLLYATAMKTDTVIVNKIGFQKTKSAKERFQRPAFVYSQEILDEWRDDVINRAREMMIFERINHYPRNRTSCEKWNGCYLQRYCSTKPKAREFLIGSEYLVGPGWDIGKKLEEEEQKSNK